MISLKKRGSSRHMNGFHQNPMDANMYYTNAPAYSRNIVVMHGQCLRVKIGFKKITFRHT